MRQWQKKNKWENAIDQLLSTEHQHKLLVMLTNNVKKKKQIKVKIHIKLRFRDIAFTHWQTFFFT